MKPWAVIALALALAACTAPDRSSGGGLEPLGPMAPPAGAIAAPILDADGCAQDPACVCTLPADLRPLTIKVPEIVRQIRPDIPEEIDVDCSPLP